MVLYVFSLTSNNSCGFIRVFPHCQLTQPGFKVFSLTSVLITQRLREQPAHLFLAPSATFLMPSFHIRGLSSQHRSSYNNKIHKYINIKLYLA